MGHMGKKPLLSSSRARKIRDNRRSRANLGNLISCSPTAPDWRRMASFARDPAHADGTLGSDAVSADSTHGQNGQNGADLHGNSTSGEHDTDNDTPGKKKKGTKRRKVNHACLYCRRSHMTCDEGRPCQRWCGSHNLLLPIGTSPVLTPPQHQARDRPPLSRRAANHGEREGVYNHTLKFHYESPHRRRTGSPWRVYSSPPCSPNGSLTSQRRMSSPANL